jgi:hypothetical protein
MATRGRPKGSKNSQQRINLDAYRKIVERRKLEQQLPTRCARCGGPMLPGYDDATCLNCGEYVCTDKTPICGSPEFPPAGDLREGV